MSGPKTSQLEIERMIRAQLEALRSDVDHGRARARRRIASLRDELLAEAEGCAEAADAAQSVRRLAEAALAKLTGECAFKPATVMKDSMARAEWCTARAAAIADAFENEVRPLAERIRRARAQADSATESQDFATLLAQAAEESTAEMAISTARSFTASEHCAKLGAASAAHPAPTAEAADLVQDASRRALELVASPFTLPADRTLLLETVREWGPETAAQLALLLPTMETNAEAMADLADLVEDAEAELRGRGVALPAAVGAFATLEEAAARLEALRALHAQADCNAYLRACIDEVMARRGYAIARSVTMGRDLAGTHRLFGRNDATEGLHAFVSDQGDLMLQVTGLPSGIEAVAEGEVVSMEPAEAGQRTDALLDSQRDFCAIYDEIAEDLASFGITNAVRYRAEPDAAFCREVLTAKEAASRQDAEEQSRATERRRKRISRAVREMR